jgi:hypothetical protein
MYKFQVQVTVDIFATTRPLQIINVVVKYHLVHATVVTGNKRVDK